MKPWYKSKTVWFNLLTFGGAVAAGVTGLLPVLQPVLGVEVYTWSLFIFSAVNIMLRAVTNSGIVMRKPNAKEPTS